MGEWVLVQSLAGLRTEFNTISPKRDKGADGAIGDSAHTSSSDHTPDEDSDILRGKDGDSKNEVHAVDIDSSGPWPGEGTQKERFHRLVMRVVAGEKKKWLDSNDMCRLNYVIWDGHIYDKDNDFNPVVYSGKDPHTNHGHFSSRYETQAENDTRPWGVAEEAEMELTDKIKLSADTVKAIGKTGDVTFDVEDFFMYTLLQAGRSNQAATSAKELAQTASNNISVVMSTLNSMAQEIASLKQQLANVQAGGGSVDIQALATAFNDELARRQQS